MIKEKMKITQTSKEARKLFTLYDGINKYNRSHVLENFRRERESGITILKGIVVLGFSICILGAIMFFIPMIGGQ